MKRALIPGQNKLMEFLSKQEHVRLAYLFGSVARGEAGKLSDVDMAVLLDDSLNKKERFDLQLKLISDITAILKTDGGGSGSYERCLYLPQLRGNQGKPSRILPSPKRH